METTSKNSQDLGPILHKNLTTHMSTLPTGKIASVEFRLTTVELPQKRNIDLSTPIYSVYLAYQFDTTEPMFFIKI